MGGSVHIRRFAISVCTITTTFKRTQSNKKMANLVLALGLFALVAQSQGFGMGAFPGMGGMMGAHNPMGGMGMGGFGGGYGGGMGGGYGGYQGRDKDDRHQEFLTCISKDDDDLTSQIRLTLTRNRRANTVANTQAPWEVPALWAATCS